MEVVSIDLYLKKIIYRYINKLKKIIDVNLFVIRIIIWYRFLKNMYNLYILFKFNVVIVLY